MEHATTPTPQSYNSKGLIIGGPASPGHWDDDIPSGKEDEGEVDQNSIQSNTLHNPANQLMSKDEKLNNLFSSLLEAGNFVQSLVANRGIEDAHENQHITRCMTGLANALLNQPYRVIMDQQAEIIWAIQEVNNSVTMLTEKVASNEEKIEQIREEATYNASAVAKQVNNIGTTMKDTQTHISALEAKTTSLKTTNAENPNNANNINSFATGPTFKPKGKSSTLHSHCFSNGFRQTFVGPCHFRWIQRTVHRTSTGVCWNPSEMTKSAASPATVQWKSAQAT